MANKEIPTSLYFRDHDAATYSFEGDGDMEFSSNADPVEPLAMAIHMAAPPAWALYPFDREIMGRVSIGLDDTDELPTGSKRVGMNQDMDRY